MPKGTDYVGYHEEDKSISVLEQGAATAGLMATAIGAPTLWKTLKSNFPKGVGDSFLYKYVMKRRVNGVTDAMVMVQADWATKTSDPEGAAKVFTESFFKKKAEISELGEIHAGIAEVTNGSAGQSMKEEAFEVAQLLDQSSDDIITASHHPEAVTKMRELENATVQKSGISNNINRGNALIVQRKEAMRVYIQTLSSSETKAIFHKTKDEMINIVKSGSKPHEINPVFNQAINKDTRFVRNYIGILKGTGPIKVDSLGRRNVSGPSSYLQWVMNDSSDDANRISNKLLGPEQANFKKVELINLTNTIKGVDSYKAKTGVELNRLNSAIDSAIDKIFSHEKQASMDNFVPTFYPDPKVKTSTRFRSFVREITRQAGIANDISRSSGGDSINISVGWETVDKARKIDRATVVIRKGNMKYDIPIPVANEGGIFISGNQYLNSTGNKLKGRGEALVEFESPISMHLKKLEQNAKRIINDAVGSNSQHRGGIVNTLNKQLIDAGADYLPGSKKGVQRMAGIKNDYASDIFTSQRRRINKMNGLKDWNMYRIAKNTGRDFVVYDTEYFNPNVAGSNQRRKVGQQLMDPKSTHVWQVSYKVVDSEFTDVLKHETMFVRNEKIIKDPVALKQWRTMLAEDLQYTPKQIAEAEANMRSGISMNQLKSKLSSDFRGKVKVDYSGRLADRPLLNEIMGKGFITEGSSLDVYSMKIAMSGRRYGHGLGESFSETINLASPTRLEEIKKMMVNLGTSKGGRGKFVERISQIKKGSKNEKRNIVLAFQQYAHDAETDIIPTLAVLQDMAKQSPLIGRATTVINEVNQYALSGNVPLERLMNELNNFNASVEMNGASKSLDMLYKGKLMTHSWATSPGSLMHGRTSGANPLMYNIAGIQNNFNRQAHQLWDGETLLSAGSDGMMKSPQNIAIEKFENEIYKGAVAKNVQRNSDAALMNVMFVPKGYVAEGAGLIQEHTARSMHRIHTGSRMSYNFLKSSSIGVSDSMLNMHPSINSIMKRAKNLQSTHSIYSDNFQGAIDKVLSDESNQIAKIHSDIRTLSGARQGHLDGLNKKLKGYFRIKNNEVIVEGRKGSSLNLSKTRFEDWNSSRIARLEAKINDVGNLTSINMEMQKLVNPMETHSKFYVETGKVTLAPSANLDTLFRPLDEDGASEMLLNKGKVSIVMEDKFLDRRDIGSFKKIHFQRTMAGLIKAGQGNEAEKLAREVYGDYFKQMLPNGTVKFNIAGGNIDAMNEVINRMDTKRMARYLSKTDLTWSDKSVQSLHKFYGLQERFKWNDRIGWTNYMDDEIKRRSEKLSQIASSTSVDDNIQQKMYKNMVEWDKGVLNPYYDSGEGKLKRSYKANPRFNDFMMHGNDIVMGTIAPADVRISSHSIDQYKPGHLGKAPISAEHFVIESQMTSALGRDFNKSVLHNVMHRSKGRKLSGARQSASKFIGAFISGDMTVGKHQNIVNLTNNDLNSVVNHFNTAKNLKNVPLNSANASDYLGEDMLKRVSNELSAIDDQELLIQRLKNKKSTDGSLSDAVDNLEKMRKNVKGRLKVSEEIPKPVTKLLADDAIDSMWRDVKRTEQGGRGGQIKLGNKNVSTWDVISMSTPKGVKNVIPTGTMETVINEIAEAEFMKSDVKRAMLLGLESMSELKDKIYLPSPGAIMDLTDAVYQGRKDLGNRTIRLNKTMLSMENVLHSVNELNNMHGRGVKESNAEFKLMSNKLSENWKLVFTDILQYMHGKKRGLSLDYKYNFEGTYLKTSSKLTFMHELNARVNGWGATSKQKIKTIRTMLEKRSVKKYSSEILDVMAQNEYKKTTKLVEMLNTPGTNAMTRQQFKSMEIEGMSYIDYFMQQPNASKKTRYRKGSPEFRTLAKKMGSIYNGNDLVDLLITRDPVANYHGVLPSKFVIIDPTMIALENLAAHDNLVIDPMYATFMKNDFDGDHVHAGMLLTQSIDDVNNISKETRKWHKGIMDSMSEYNRIKMKNPNMNHNDILALLFKEGTPRNVAYTGDLIEKLGTNFGVAPDIITDASGNETIKWRNMGYSEKMKAGFVEEFNFLADMQNSKMFKDMTIPEVMDSMKNAGRIAVASKKMVGDVASKVTRLQILTKKFTELMNNNPTKLQEMFKDNSYVMKILNNKGSDFKTLGSRIESAMSGMQTNVFKAEGSLSSMLLDNSIETSMDILKGAKEETISGKHAVNLRRLFDASKGILSIGERGAPEQYIKGAIDQMTGGNSGTAEFLTKVLPEMERIATTDPVMKDIVKNEMSAFTYKGIGKGQVLFESLKDNIAMNDPKKLEIFMKNVYNIYGVGSESAGVKASRNWANSIRQLIYGKSSSRKIKGLSKEFLTPKTDKFHTIKKFIYDHNTFKWGGKALIGIAALTLLNPNQLSGGISDFGIDIGHRPGSGGERGDVVTRSPLSNFTANMPIIGDVFGDLENDPFSHKWTKMVEDNPILDDRRSDYSGKSHKSINDYKFQGTYQQNDYKSGKASTSNRYIDNRSRFSKFYKTNDTRKAQIVGNFNYGKY